MNMLTRAIELEKTVNIRLQITNLSETWHSGYFTAVPRRLSEVSLRKIYFSHALKKILPLTRIELAMATVATVDPSQEESYMRSATPQCNTQNQPNPPTSQTLIATSTKQKFASIHSSEACECL